MRTTAQHIKAAKQITEIENRTRTGKRILKSISKTPRRSRVIGITGPLGCGKSTLINALIGKFRQAGKKVGVLAVDPTSPKTGGALLGDRIRMQRHTADDGVFIRSMATRGAAGGIPDSIAGAVKVLENIGKDIILIETTGAGQCEIAIRDVADTVVLVLTPSQTDDMQLLKAGIIEIADIIVVNKSDTTGVSVAAKVSGLTGVPVVETSALKGEGIEELFKNVNFNSAHRDSRKKS